jgi:stearoyl-CoA desaturase (delta-9 desaturase)
MQTVRDKINLLTQISYIKYFGLTVVPLAFLYVVSIYLYSWTWISTATFVLFYVLIYIYGINIFYHRYWSHRQFTTHPFIERFFTAMGYLAMIGGPAPYALIHRWHHAHSDTDKDPHNPAHGRWHAFIGWLFTVEQNTSPGTVIKDFFESKNSWVFTLEKYKVFIPWFSVVIAYSINPSIALGLMTVMFLAHLIELYLNGFLHNPKTHEAMNDHWVLCWLTAGGLMHRLHHDHPTALPKEDPGYWFVKVIGNVRTN